MWRGDSNATTRRYMLHYNEDDPHVMSLMYADDLEQFCNQWGLVVNMAKTKIIVFFGMVVPLKHFENIF